MLRLVLLETEYGKDVCFLVGEDEKFLHIVDRFGSVSGQEAVWRRYVHKNQVRKCIDLLPGRSLLDVECMLKQEFALDSSYGF